MAREIDFVDECYADKDLSLLKKLTLVIPTYNRNYYLSRCLWYHAHFPFGQIIVADSSPEEKKVVNRETVAKVREMFGADILYLEYEPETEKYGGDIYRKWGDAVMHVETEYSQICTDKEFLMPSVLLRCIRWLDINDNYSSASGIRYTITNKNNKYCLESWSPNISVYDGETILKRLNTYNASHFPDELLLTIQRTSNHKKYFKNMVVYNMSDIRFGEAFLELQPLFYGKVMRFTGDTVKLRDESNLWTGHVNKDDSSTLRYPPLRMYPLWMKITSMHNLYLFISNIYENDSDSREIAEAKKNVNEIIRWWFSLSIFDTIIKFVYERIYYLNHKKCHVPIFNQSATSEQSIQVILSVCKDNYEQYCHDTSVI